LYASGQFLNRDSYYGANKSLSSYGNSKDKTYNFGVHYKAIFKNSSLITGLENTGGFLTDKKLGYPDYENAVIVNDSIVEVPHTKNKIIIEQSSSTLGIFTQYELKLNKTKIAVGGRYDHYEVKNFSENETKIKKGNIFSPRINLMYEIVKELQSRISYAKGYRAPQIFDEDLDIKIEIPAGGRPQIIQPISDAREWNVTLCHTGLDSEKGERIRRIREHVADDGDFMVTYGDGLADIDMRELVRFHQQHGKVATLTAIRARSQFGHVALNDNAQVTRMVENPVLPELINGGFMVFSTRIFDWLEPGDSLEAGALRRLAEAGELMAYVHEGFWACMDTYKDTLRLNELWSNGKAPWKKW